MRALILNSGLGKRMGEYTQNNPKCMVEIEKNETIVSRQLRLLKQVGITEVIMTTGPFQAVLEEHVRLNSDGMKIQFVNNPKYDTTNYIYSMFLAKDYLEDDVILMHGDLVFEESVISDVIYSSNSCMTISHELPLPEKDFKAVISDGKIVAVGIEFMSNAFAAQPIYHLKKSDFLIWLDEIERFCKEGVVSCYAENAFNKVSQNMHVVPLDYGNRLCQEIDREEDLLEVKHKLMNL